MTFVFLTLKGKLPIPKWIWQESEWNQMSYLWQQNMLCQHHQSPPPHWCGIPLLMCHQSDVPGSAESQVGCTRHLVRCHSFQSAYHIHGIYLQFKEKKKECINISMSKNKYHFGTASNGMAETSNVKNHLTKIYATDYNIYMSNKILNALVQKFKISLISELPEGSVWLEKHLSFKKLLKCFEDRAIIRGKV